MANTRRMNRLEELGRVDAEKAFNKKGKRNLKAEKKRIIGEMNSGGAAKRGLGVARMNSGGAAKRGLGVARMNMGGRTGDMMYSRGYGVDEKSKRVPTMLMDRGPSMKRGGRVGKKEQGYKDRKDESIAMRRRKKRTIKQLKASRDESYGKFGSKAKKSGKINK